MPTGKKANTEIYIKERLKGKSQVDAYKKANPDSIAQGNGPYESASRMESKLKARLAQLQQRVNDGAVMNLQQAIAALAEIAADDMTKPEVRVNALDKIIKAAGGYTDRHEIQLSGSLSLDDKRQAARAWIDELTGDAAREPQER